MCKVQLVAMPCMKWKDISMLHCSGIVRLAVWWALWFVLASRQIWLILTVPNARCVTHTVLKGQHPIAVAFVPKSAEVQKILVSLLSWPRAVGWLIIFRQSEKSGLESSQQAYNQHCYWMLSGSRVDKVQWTRDIFQDNLLTLTKFEEDEMQWNATWLGLRPILAVQGVLDGLNQVIQGTLQGHGNPMKSIPIGISPCAEFLWGSMFVYRISNI